MYRIVGVEFGLTRAKDVVAASVVEVHDNALYTGADPRPHGVNDLRLGSTSGHCTTCGLDARHCMGHTGHLDLARPQYHVCFVDVVVKVLRCVCFFCSRLLVTEYPTGKTGKKKLSAISNRAKTRLKCPHCDAPQPSYSRAGAGVEVAFPGDCAFANDDERAFAMKAFTAADARSILCCISDDDCEFIGLVPSQGRPEDMILTNLVIPPVLLRPPVAVSDGSRSRGQDDLTLKLQDIVKSNKSLRAAKTELEIRRAEDMLQVHLSLYFDKDTRCRMGNRGPRTGPCRSLGVRLKGKRGRVRGNLMGKRVDFSARSVIGPDAYLDLDEVGVPTCIAKTQTFGERVTDWNRAWLRRLVDAGPTALAGAQYVTYADGRLVSLKMARARSKIPLPSGAVVHRHLRDGDLVVMNRQPSLHKESMMAHRDRIIHGIRTLLLPVLDTPPF